jgi:hypothetical protein
MKKWNEWQDNSTSTYAISTTWKSLQQTDVEHQPVSERCARWRRGRRTRQERKEMKSIPYSWNSAVSTPGQVIYQCRSHSCSTVLSFMYMLGYSFSN